MAWRLEQAKGRQTHKHSCRLQARTDSSIPLPLPGPRAITFEILGAAVRLCASHVTTCSRLVIIPLTIASHTMIKPPLLRATDQHIRSMLIDIATQRGFGSSACPSEVARKLDVNDWRMLMPRVRAVASQLALDGIIDLTQRGVRLDPTLAWVGPIRIQLAQPEKLN